MRFKLVDPQTHDLLNPADQLPAQVLILFAPDVKQVSFTELTLTESSPLDDYPMWKCCLIKANAFKGTLSMQAHPQSLERCLELRFAAVVESSMVEPQYPKPINSQLVDEIQNQPDESKQAITSESLSQETDDSISPQDHEAQDMKAVEFDSELILKGQLMELLRSQIQMTERLKHQLTVQQQPQSQSHWSTQQQIESLLCHSENIRAVEDSTKWIVGVRSELMTRLELWKDLSSQRKTEVRRLIELMEQQGLDIAKPPTWLLCAERCEAQAENYRNYISVYQEVTPDHSSPSL